MKNITTILLIVFSLNIFSLEIMPVEENKVIYKGVVELDPSLTQKQIYDSVRSFLSSSNLHRKFGLGDSTGMDFFVTKSGLMGTIESNLKNRSTFISEDNPKTIKVNFFQYFEGKGAGGIRTLHIDANLKVDVKDGKYRYKLSNFTWNHWNHHKGVQMSIWSTKKDCKDRGTLYQLQNLCNRATKKRKEALTALDKDINIFFAELKAAVSEIDEDEDADW
tara:strand:+ start:86 stop:745 length:660 start_codon:yes stop_codon:yes gene_type:complete